MDRLRALEPQRRWRLTAPRGRSLSKKIWCRRDADAARSPRIRAPWSSATLRAGAPTSTPCRGKRCYPLTLTDNHSRFILQCRALMPSSPGRSANLPERLRTDNGPPFASVAAGGLSQVEVVDSPGIRPERIRPAKPSENGRHERMHRSLKEAVMRPPARTLAAQQRRFDAFARSSTGSVPMKPFRVTQYHACRRAMSGPHRRSGTWFAVTMAWMTASRTRCCSGSPGPGRPTPWPRSSSR